MRTRLWQASTRWTMTAAAMACAAALTACGSDGGSSPATTTTLPDVTIDTGSSFGKDSTAFDTAAPDTSTPDVAVCTPTCKTTGAECGDDGCGGNCGFCKTNFACVSGVCKELASPDACAKVQCDPNANCLVSASGQAQCVCKTFWTGDGKSCVDLNECLTNNGGCDANALCTNNPGAQPSCACAKGFTGNGTKCFDDDECKASPAPCGEHAVCTNKPGSFDCACDDGYAGDATKLCKDIDECAAGKAKCGATQTCENTIGGYACTCAAGYAKSGTSCKDVDECATATAGCSTNATCANTPGGYTCACKSGFTGDGKTCTEVDLCLNVSCGANALCQKNATSGKAECVCGPGYLGDGKTCTAAVVDIALVGAWIAPVASDGQCWDLNQIGQCTPADKTKIDAINAAMAALNTAFNAPGTAALSKMAAVEAALANLGTSVTFPDAYGTIALSPTGGSFVLADTKDTHKPTWTNAKWSKISMGKTTELKLTLADADLAFDEDIGTVTLKVDALAKALQLGDVIAVPVYAQEPQILAVLVKVTAWKGCGDGKCDAATETATSCKADCAVTGPKCGDAVCDKAGGETSVSCPTDCKAPAGTCVGFCGKQAADGCWCDDFCETSGDCCADKVKACAVGCKGLCGQQSKDATGKACYCDEFCTDNGDCCSDYATMCVQ